MKAIDYLLDIMGKYYQIISQIEQVCLDADHGYINTSEAYSRIKSLVIESGEMYSNVNTEKVTQSFDEDEFIEKYCYNCGTQRCEGIGTPWFDGCEHRFELKGYKESNG